MADSRPAADSAGAPNPVSEGHATRPATVLCVDGSPASRDVRRRILAAKGYDVIEAASGADALRLAAERQPSLVLLDVDLPDINGFAVCRRLKSNPKTALIPVLHISSAGKGDQNYPEALESGADAYLQEPVEPPILAAVVAFLIRTAAAEARSRKAERDAIGIMEDIHEAVFLLDQDHRFTYVNAETERLTGLERSALLGKTQAEVFPQAIATVAEREYRRVPIERASISFESFYEPLRKWFEITASPVREGGIAVHFRDITGRKHSDDVLRESEERFRSLADGCPAIIWVADAEGNNRFINRAYREFFGVTYEQVEGMKWRPLVHPDDEPGYVAAFVRGIRERAPVKAEARVRRADGEWRWIASYAEPRFSAGGEFLGHAGISPDITERKQVEQALAEAVQRLNAHMDNSPLAVIEFDPRFRVTRWSKEAERVFGWSGEEILGRAIEEMRWVHEDDAEAVRRISEDMLRGTQPRNMHVNRNYRKDGSVVECEWYNSAIYDAEGKLGSILSQVLDVTDRKRTEERLRQAQKMESIALLAGGVAHDFNNLLVGVIGNASLAVDMLPPESPAEELLRRIIKSGEQAAHLTRQLLAYSGKGRFVIQPVDLSDVVREVTELVRSTAPKKIAIQLDFEPGLPPIEADRGQIHQVLMNLIINAAEAIGNEAGLIAVRTGVRRVDERFVRELEGWHITTGKYVVLEVRDSGPGMDEAVKARLFDPFFTTKAQGRGLGLAAVAGIVRGHKGAIRVESAPGRGACFLLLFPAMDSALAARAAAGRTATEQDLKTCGPILVVDDEETVRDMVKSALERRGCEVLVATSGSEALDMFSRHADTVSLIILDLSMPDMSGSEVLPKLLAINSRVDVVVSSGYAESDTLRLFEGMPVAGFIQKPYTAQRLVETVRQVLDRKRKR